jgi:RNA polymerase sigma-B factor
MRAPGDTVLTAAAQTPSEYADLMPKLREFAALPAGDPLRGVLREELILAFLPVVQHLAARHARHVPASAEELTQAGTVALITAIDRWDPEMARGEFLGYLIPCVRGEMLRWFRDRTWSMRVPRRLKDLSVAIGRAGDPLSQELGRAPRPSELAAHLGATVEEVIEALEAHATTTRVRWMRSIRRPGHRWSSASVRSTESWNWWSTATPCVRCWTRFPSGSG